MFVLTNGEATAAVATIVPLNLVKSNSIANSEGSLIITHLKDRTVIRFHRQFYHLLLPNRDAARISIG